MADWINEETKSVSFRDIKGLQPWMLRQLHQLRIEQPTPVQYHCIQPVLEGQDVIGVAKTGSGKTLAFVIPILQKLSVDPYGIFALVLTPTRELALQIADQFKNVGVPVAVKVSVIIGGLNKVLQGAELSRVPHIVIATPGRLSDHLQTTHDFTLKRIQFLVLDEADRLMDGRFDEQLQIIWKALPEKRQTLLFTATITHRVQRMKELASVKVFFWQSKGEQATVAQLDESYALINKNVKDACLVAVLLKYQNKNPKSLIMIFTETCKIAQILMMTLQKLGIEAVTLHSMISQQERIATLTHFKSSQAKVLVATDLGSRGLDIPKVGLVINYTVPNIPRIYIHRVGRTARAGRTGHALTLVAPDELKLLLAVEAETKRKMAEYKVDETLMKKVLKEVNITRREQEICLDETSFDERRNIHKRMVVIMNGKDPGEEQQKNTKRLKRLQRKRHAEQTLLKQQINKFLKSK